MMLDVLFKIKDEQDQTLAFRRSCRCGDMEGRLQIAGVHAHARGRRAPHGHAGRVWG